MNCHHVGFKSLRAVIFSPFFGNTCVFSLVTYCIFLYFIRPLVTNLLPGLGGPKQGSCVEVPGVPSPPKKMRMCLLDGMIDPNARLNRPLFQVDIVLCEAYEICMPVPDDTSNIGGAGLG